jgi:hypothetical protein
MAKYPTMSIKLNKQDYGTHRFTKVMFSGRVVKVDQHRRSNRYGSWERGFKFTDTTIGVLVRQSLVKYPYKLRHAKWWQRMRLRCDGYIPVSRKVNEYSTDHGKTWHRQLKDALKSQGKVILNRDTRGEMAFDAIQQLNRKWDGPGYKWYP